MKHGNKFYLELSRELFTDTYEDLHYISKWIFVGLNELEQRYVNKGDTFFYRSDENLAKDCGISVASVRRYKKILIDRQFIQHWNMHWIDPITKKKSERKVSAYRILM